MVILQCTFSNTTSLRKCFVGAGTKRCLFEYEIHRRLCNIWNNVCFIREAKLKFDPKKKFNLSEHNSGFAQNDYMALTCPGWTFTCTKAYVWTYTTSHRIITRKIVKNISPDATAEAWSITVCVNQEPWTQKKNTHKKNYILWTGREKPQKLNFE